MNRCLIITILVAFLVAFASGFVVHQLDTRIISKQVDTVKVVIRDTITVYVGSSAHFLAKRCEEVQWKGELKGLLSQGFYSQTFQTSQTVRPWGLGLYVWYDVQTKAFSPIFSYRYQHYYFWIKPVQPYGLGFGLQF